MFFEFNQVAKLTGINPRPELHGEEPKPACDIMFAAIMANTVLNRFAQGLLDSIYKEVATPDLVDQVSDTPAVTALRYPGMSAFKWEFTGTGYTLEIDFGMGGDSNIKLGDIQIDKFKLEPQEGGSVCVSWRAIAHPDEKDIGKLYRLMQRDVQLILTPPEPKTLQEAFGDAPPVQVEQAEAEAA
ncbi:hypothetical protein [Massilia varians]|uniref:hypothetical protein n=1 Tax=Massilia varians TaxID=457921 RepID=UPI00255632DD|nr:hypothetical protein [Massilia varians]MDK6077908.1 hypothetical protein [Massilia varians]